MTKLTIMHVCIMYKFICDALVAYLLFDLNTVLSKK
jgi:hypothetical protein